MAFDYCTPAEAFGYGGSAGNSSDPINEQAMMADVVTACSRAIDTACHQTFYRETYTDQRYRARIDRSGILTIAVGVPTIASITAASYRVEGGLSWLSPDLSEADTEEHPYGTIVRFLTSGLLGVRGGRVDVKLSFTGGYASASVMPADLRWACKAAAWYEYQRRSAPLDKTAMPSMGIVIIPGDWPKHITSKLAAYTRPVAS